jgi:hypothetical protein
MAPQRFAFSASEQVEPFLHGHLRLPNDGEKKPALDVADG